MLINNQTVLGISDRDKLEHENGINLVKVI